MANELELLEGPLLFLRTFLELLKILKKDASKKFIKEWKKDEKKFIKALADGDANIINFLFSKYINML